MSPARSPYEVALGDAAFGEGGLHPRLRTYFSAIPDGMCGVGHGVFTTVGASRRWLRPVLRTLVDGDVLFPVWERDVPFTVVNRASTDEGGPAVAGERTFHFASGDRVMRDVIGVTASGLIDTLGARRRFRAFFAATVADGSLRLESTRVDLRLGSRFLPVPRRLAPRIALSERFSDVEDAQAVRVTLTLPLLGTFYEYEGLFTYELKEGTP